MKFLQEILNFITKHKTFIKKLILFTVLYIVIIILNQPQVLNLFNQIFGENITLALTPLCTTILVGD